jgi:hypothetical protein
MIDLGLPYITGYKPRGNYQGLLKETTENLIESSPELIHVIKMDVEKGAELQHIDNILDAFVLPPAPQNNSISVCENQAGYGETENNFSKINYLEREARNTSLGAVGEKFVLEYEKTRLMSIEKFNFVDRIEQISETRGDWIKYVLWTLYNSGLMYD